METPTPTTTIDHYIPHMRTDICFVTGPHVCITVLHTLVTRVSIKCCNLSIRINCQTCLHLVTLFQKLSTHIWITNALVHTPCHTSSRFSQLPPTMLCHSCYLPTMSCPQNDAPSTTHRVQPMHFTHIDRQPSQLKHDWQ